MRGKGHTATRRLAALLTMGALVLMGTLTLGSSASAGDLEATSEDAIETIGARPWPAYGLGDQHPDIAAARDLLAHLGHAPPPGEDAQSEFDDRKQTSVRALQAAHGLHEHGRLDAETWEMLRGQTFGGPGPAARASPSDSPPAPSAHTE
ncbi:peptidoglycan-binding domain-containing protein [Nocardiopsis xinjiangensis]|uniref:peptidoglycan-binding domain-containing protein n=1 Tax=Nocardiopsis xinjiangensis TaxID=124285 RepID=UPI000347A373|nr:peptidoglycan-binding domain-containing protein [Nocardiopsis xinjiangensis]